MDVDSLDRVLTDLSDSDRFSGVVRVEVGRDVTFESAYGLADRTWGIPCTPRIRFDTASITKVFTAAATLQQIEAGAFALDTGVVEYLGLTHTALSARSRRTTCSPIRRASVTTPRRSPANATRMSGSIGRTTP